MTPHKKVTIEDRLNALIKLCSSLSADEYMNPQTKKMREHIYEAIDELNLAKKELEKIEIKFNDLV